jgi:hypothetical protein
MRLIAALLLTLPFMVFGQDTDDLPYIQNDSFVANTFGFPATVRNFQKNFRGKFTITKKPIKNIHNSTVVDTVYTFSAGKTKIELYKAKHRDILQSAYIDTDKIPLKFNIKIGDSKTDVAKRLKADITVNQIQVGDLEQGQVYTLKFSKGKLTSISYEGYVD